MRYPRLRPPTRSCAALPAIAALLVIVAGPGRLHGQTVDILSACYIPGTGTLYLIEETDAPAQCVAPEHILIQWNEEGLVGPAGPAGPQGEAGPAGEQGPAGDAGTAGEAGPAGEPGPQGPLGPPGLNCWDRDGDGVADPAENVNGDNAIDWRDCQGSEGEQGDPGPSGPEGPQGEAGPAGATGPQGPQGDPGPVGPTGPQGPQGASGLSGYTLMNDNASWTGVSDQNNVYEATINCPAGLTAFSVGVNGAGALNNVVSMAIVGAQSNAGYFRVRTQGGSGPSEVFAQLVCADVG